MIEYILETDCTPEDIPVSYTLDIAVLENSENRIKWKKDRSFSLKYIFDGLEKNYFPDFYLPERNEYIEIKGHWFKSPDGRVDDKRKMRLVAENNPTLTIRILDSMKLIEDFE